ncbi:MAG: tetratricopeptide repeat protein [Nanoarchaeota archaeon]
MSLESLSPEELMGKGQAFEREGKFTQAIKYFIAAQKKNPRLEFIYTALGNVYVKNKEPAKAIKAYKRSIEVKQDKNAHHNLGLLYFHLKMYEHAVHHLKEAETRGLSGDDLYFYLAKALFMTRQFNEAEKIITKGLKKTKNKKLEDIHERLKEAKKNLVKKFPGEKELLENIKKQPRNLKTYLELADYYFKKNDHDKAEQALKDAIKNNDKVLVTYANLATYYFERNRWKDAAILLEKAVEISPTEISNVNINLAINLAEAYLKLQEKKKAIKTLEKLLKLNPPKKDIIEKMIEGIKDEK